MAEKSAELSYEDARDELTKIVAKLEAGTASLDESLRLWERGEQLVRICEMWLADARERIERAKAKPAQTD